MALGPEHSEAVIKAREAEKKRYQDEQRRKALKYLNKVAKATELALDKEIQCGYGPQIDASKISAQYGFFTWHLTRVKLVLEYARGELAAILEKKYLPLGWKRVEVSESVSEADGTRYCTIRLYK